MTTQIGDTPKTIFLNDEAHKLHLEFTVDNRKGTLTLAGDLVSLNVVNGYVNSIAMAPVTYATSHTNTMNLLKAAIEAIPGVATVTLTDAVNNRQLTIVMDNQEESISLLGWVVTLGAGQTTITAAEVNNTLHCGEMVKFPGTAGSLDEVIVPIVSGEEENQILGLVRQVDNSWGGEEATIITRGFCVVYMKLVADNVVPGPVKAAGFDAATGYNKVAVLGASDEKLHIGWNLEGGSTGAIVKVLVKG